MEFDAKAKVSFSLIIKINPLGKICSRKFKKGKFSIGIHKEIF
jgi:hypothetical protein